MSRSAGVVVVDTMVISWLMDARPNSLADEYRRLIGARAVVLAFQTVAELRFGALRAEWGELRKRRLERSISGLTVVQPDDSTATIYARLRATATRSGHALGGKTHDGDRWIAATAVRLECPLVSDDKLFDNVPGLDLLTVARG